jgi:hypothetical protein
VKTVIGGDLRPCSASQPFSGPLCLTHFERFPVADLSHDRNHSTVRKVGVVDDLPRLAKRAVTGEFDELEVRRYEFRNRDVEKDQVFNTGSRRPAAVRMAFEEPDRLSSL